MRRRGMYSLAAGVLLALGIGVFVFSVSRMTTYSLAPQSRFNLGFAGKPSLQTALAQYPSLWTPLYPSLLWIGRQAGIPAADIDRTFFCVALLLMWAITNSYLRGISPSYPLLLFTVAHFTYVNLHQRTSENLVVPLTLLLFWFLLRSRTQPGWGHVVAMAVTTSALCITRYFCLFWLLPLATLCLTTLPQISVRRRLAYIGFLFVITLLPVALWMLHAYMQTGFVTGMDRHVPRFAPQTDLYHNLLFLQRTVVIDFFSPVSAATHRAITFRGPLTATEVTLLLTLAAAMVTSLLTFMRRQASEPPTAPLSGAFPWLVAFTATYPIILVTLWTVGNNDPLYTRYLYPSYPFVTLLAFEVYRRTRARATSVVAPLPWWALYWGVVGVQCRRILGAVLAES